MDDEHATVVPRNKDQESVVCYSANSDLSTSLSEDMQQSCRTILDHACGDIDNNEQSEFYVADTSESYGYIEDNEKSEFYVADTSNANISAIKAMHPLDVCPVFVRIPEIARRQKYPVYTSLPIGVCDTCLTCESSLVRVKLSNKDANRIMKVPGVGMYNRLIFAGNKEDPSYIDTQKNPLPIPGLTETLKRAYHTAPTRGLQFSGIPMTHDPPVFEPYQPVLRPFPPYPLIRYEYPRPVPLFLPPSNFPRSPYLRPSYYDIPPYYPNPHIRGHPRFPYRPVNSQRWEYEHAARANTLRNSGATPKISKINLASDVSEQPIENEEEKHIADTYVTDEVLQPAEADVTEQQAEADVTEQQDIPRKKKRHRGKKKKKSAGYAAVQQLAYIPPYEPVLKLPDYEQYPQYVMPYRDMVPDNPEYYMNLYAQEPDTSYKDQLLLPASYIAQEQAERAALEEAQQSALEEPKEDYQENANGTIPYSP